MAAAATNVMCLVAVLSVFATAATSQAAGEELHVAQTALASDDLCSTDDGACALNARQLRGAALAPDGADGLEHLPEVGLKMLAGGPITAEAESHPKKDKKVDDISEKGEERLNEEIKEVKNKQATNLTKELGHLENMTSTIKRKLMEGEIGDLDAAPAGGQVQGTAAGGRRRRAHEKVSVPPGRKRVQKKLDGCQKVLDKMWIRMKRQDRLNYWIRAKIGNPTDTPDFIERADGTSVEEDAPPELEGESQSGSPKKWEMDFMKVIKGLNKQMDDMHIELMRMQNVTDELQEYFCDEYWCPGKDEKTPAKKTLPDELA